MSIIKYPSERGRRGRRRFTFIFNHFLYNICLGNGREGGRVAVAMELKGLAI